MSTKRKLNPLPIFDEDSLLNFFSEKDIKTCHAYQIWHYLIKHPEATILDVPRLPQILYDELPSRFVRLTSKLKEAHTSQDKTTTKLVIELQDGHLIEAVIMRHINRATLCVSSQVGCLMGCTFCATGTMGFLANLTAGEICEQLLIANDFEPIRNIVFMGMGEPLNNFNAVHSAILAMIDQRRFRLSPSHITVSTVGVTPYILKMTKVIPRVNLALSLHAPNQTLREQIIPTAKHFPLDSIISAIKDHLDKTKKKIFIEYIMIANVNVSPEIAHELGQLLKDMNIHVNLIPYNPTLATPSYAAPTSAELSEFQSILRQNYNIPTTVRVTMGQDVSGACGQLVVGSKDKVNSNVTDIEDMGDKLKGGLRHRQKKNNNNNKQEEQQEDSRNKKIDNKIDSKSVKSDNLFKVIPYSKTNMFLSVLFVSVFTFVPFWFTRKYKFNFNNKI